MNRLLALLLTASTLVCSSAAAAGNQFAISAGSEYGSLDGYMQTPAGGQPGSTSNKRPAFDEPGFDTVSIYDLYASAEWGQHEILGGAQFIRQSGSSTISDDLISQNQYFAAGDVVKSGIKTGWYRLNYLYKLKHLNSPGDRLTVSPAAGIV